jgi:RNA polymerase sigma-70 factor (ECF subfamily)
MADELVCNEGRHVFQGDLVNKNDNDVADAMLEGNVEALGILVDRYQHLVFTIAFRIVRDRGEAEDLVQDLFLLIYRKVKLFDRSKGIFKVWLLRCAYTLSMKRLDKLQRRKFYVTVELEDAGPLAIPSFSPRVGVLTDQEASRFIGQALETLNFKQRKAVELIALEGMTLLEATKILDCSLAAARNHYYRGVMKLRVFGTNGVPSSVQKCLNEISVENQKRGLSHFNPRPA